MSHYGQRPVKWQRGNVTLLTLKHPGFVHESLQVYRLDGAINLTQVLVKL